MTIPSSPTPPFSRSSVPTCDSGSLVNVPGPFSRQTGDSRKIVNPSSASSDPATTGRLRGFFVRPAPSSSMTLSVPDMMNALGTSPLIPKNRVVQDEAQEAHTGSRFSAHSVVHHAQPRTIATTPVTHSEDCLGCRVIGSMGLAGCAAYVLYQRQFLASVRDRRVLLGFGSVLMVSSLYRLLGKI